MRVKLSVSLHGRVFSSFLSFFRFFKSQITSSAAELGERPSPVVVPLSAFRVRLSVLGCLWPWRFHFSHCDKRFFNLALHRASLPAWPQWHHLILLLFSSFISWLARANSILLNFWRRRVRAPSTGKNKGELKTHRELGFLPLRDARRETRD